MFPLLDTQVICYTRKTVEPILIMSLTDILNHELIWPSADSQSHVLFVEPTSSRKYAPLFWLNVASNVILAWKLLI